MGVSDVMMGQVNTIFQHKKPLEHFSEATYTVYCYTLLPNIRFAGDRMCSATFSSGTRLYVLCILSRCLSGLLKGLKKP